MAAGITETLERPRPGEEQCRSWAARSSRPHELKPALMCCHGVTVGNFGIEKQQKGTGGEFSYLPHHLKVCICCSVFIFWSGPSPDATLRELSVHMGGCQPKGHPSPPAQEQSRLLQAAASTISGDSRDTVSCRTVTVMQSQNHRITKVGKDLQGPPVQPSTHHQ